MSTKRELPEDYYNSEQEENYKPPPSPNSSPTTPTKKKNNSGKSTGKSPSSKTTKTTPKKSPSTTQTVNFDALSPRAKYAIMIIEKGIEALKKDDVEAATGLNGNQQRDLVRKDKGVLRKSLISIAEKL